MVPTSTSSGGTKDIFYHPKYLVDVKLTVIKIAISIFLSVDTRGMEE